MAKARLYTSGTSTTLESNKSLAKIVRGETAEPDVGARLNRDLVDVLSWQREIFKMGVAIGARIGAPAANAGKLTVSKLDENHQR